MTTASTVNKIMAAYSLHDRLLEKYGDVMRTDQVAEFLGCHVTHVRAMCQEGKLPAVQIGKRWFVPTAKLAAKFDTEDDAYVGE